MPAPDAQRPAFALLLRQLQDAMAQANMAMARRLGMSGTDAGAIEHISLAPDPIGPAELSTRLGVTRSSATEIIDRLVGAGHIERRRDDVDRRRFRLLPTAPARRRVSAEISPLLAEIERAASSFSARDRRVIAEFLDAVTRAHRDFAERSAPEGDPNP